MELIWSNDGVSSKEEWNFLQGKAHVNGMDNQDREKRKIPTPPRIHEESVGVWGFTNTIPFCYLSSYCEYFADL